jgi:hypothetical protein
MPNSQAGGPPLVGRPRLLIQYIRSYPPFYAGCLLHPQSEDAPRCGDKGPPNMALLCNSFVNTHQYWSHY